MKEKKVWVKPELVVLVRRKPEEGLLLGCKVFASDTAVSVNFGSYDGGSCVAQTCDQP